MTGTSPQAILGMTLGDPGGVGPEIVVRALASLDDLQAHRVIIWGSAAAFRTAESLFGLRLRTRIIPPDQEEHAADIPQPGITLIDDARPDRAAEAMAVRAPTAAGGAASFWAVERAASAMRSGWIRAAATAPVAKEAWAMAGVDPLYVGQTEVFAEVVGSDRSELAPGMVFIGPRLVVALATVHVPLRRVPELLTADRVLDSIRRACEAGRLRWGREVAVDVCGVNPHAGEGGLLGDEDERVVRPAVEQARSEGLDVNGPLPADALFRSVLQLPPGRERAVAAMYHDQALTVVKAVDGYESVNVTIGLRGGALRTSPSHGTAYDIAWKSRANPSGMIAAFRLASDACIG